MSRWIEVVLNVPVYQSFTYKAPDGSEPEIGKRAEVFFGSRKMTAFIINVYNTLPENCLVEESKIKTARRIIDSEPLFDESFAKLSAWIALFYICSQGEALSAMIPSGRRGTDGGFSAFGEEPAEYTPKSLSEEQEEAVRSISVPQKNMHMHYVYGATGSGKTEVFLQCAENILKQDKGVIYLVPEISLTKQVTDAVTERFGKTVAVLHSALTPSQKLFEWQRILHKEARVVIGARSAVFAPVPDLGMIILDEEHDGSYKSGTTPRYHARQIAIKRCTDLQIPLVMGSATPSAEAWKLMDTGAISRHVLTNRLAGGAAPHIDVVDLSQTAVDGCISPRLADEIRTAKKENRQTILFLNRRGFTHFFRCHSCGYELKCKNCSVSLTYHKSENRLRCHYCGWSVTPPASCPECDSLDVGYSGFGTEFIETEIATKFPSMTAIRVDTDSVSKKGELQNKIESFKAGKADILLGTQMVAKGLNFPGVKLVGIINADTGMNMPDFRAAERTFALIVQVAGRAGRFFPDGKVIVQSWSPGRPAIDFACKSDCNGFYEQELKQREMLGFPPYSRLVRIVFRAKQQETAERAAHEATAIFENLVSRLIAKTPSESTQPSIDILGPAECALSLLSGNYRYQLLLRCSALGPMQKICTMFIQNYKSAYGVYIEVDVDPVSLL